MDCQECGHYIDSENDDCLWCEENIEEFGTDEIWTHTHWHNLNDW